jgi:myo-inositol-1-phosphate synthase
MRVGVWLIGARGSVATTAITGAAAIRTGLARGAAGCVSESADFAGAGLPDLGDLVFGGHDLSSTPLLKRAEGLGRGGVFPPILPGLVADELARAEDRMRRPSPPRPEPRS